MRDILLIWSKVPMIVLQKRRITHLKYKTNGFRYIPALPSNTLSRLTR